MRIPSDICILNCHFNPVGFRAPLANFGVAVAKLLELGVPVVTVEAAFDDEPFALTAMPGQTLIQVRAPARMWLKEALINIAMQHAPKHCTKLAWIDTDLLFERDDWLSEASRLLDTVEVVQLFDTIVYLPPNATRYEGLSLRDSRSMFGLIADEGYEGLQKIRHGIAPLPVPGGGFAARREIMAAGLYDRMVLGGGDSIFAFSLLASLDSINIVTPALARDVRLWELNFAAQRREFTQSCVRGTVYHLWHGEREHRAYSSRQDVLRLYEFNPAADVVRDENGLYRWATPKSELHEAAEQYFRARLEDGAPVAQPVQRAIQDEGNARVLISRLYRRVTEELENVEKLQRQKLALEQELSRLRDQAQDMTNWAKELKKGNEWLQNQLQLWQNRASDESAATDSGVKTVLLLTPDMQSAQSVLLHLRPLAPTVLQITGYQEGALQLRGDAQSPTTSKLYLLALPYMALSEATLSQCLTTLAQTDAATITLTIDNPLNWYCNSNPAGDGETRLIEPVQFVSLVEELQRRSELVTSAFTRGRGVTLSAESEPTELNSLSCLFPSAPLAPTALPYRSPLIEPKSYAALLRYLDAIGARALKERVVGRNGQAAGGEQGVHLG